MNRQDQSLQRLLRAAARAPKQAPDPAPFALEAAVLAGWRTNAGDDAEAMLVVLFRRAVVCAGLIMILSIGWSWWGGESEAPAARELARYELALQWTP